MTTKSCAQIIATAQAKATAVAKVAIMAVRATRADRAGKGLKVHAGIAEALTTGETVPSMQKVNFKLR